MCSEKRPLAMWLMSEYEAVAFVAIMVAIALIV